MNRASVVITSLRQSVVRVLHPRDLLPHHARWYLKPAWWAASCRRFVRFDISTSLQLAAHTMVGAVKYALSPTMNLPPKSVSMDNWERVKPACRLPDLRIAVIMDEFSEKCFGSEAWIRQIPRDNWEAFFADFKPHFVLVESAWKGKNGEWESIIAKPRFFGSTPIYELMDFCRKLGVRTAFWNKEDPIHFEAFLPVAKLADVVFTTDHNIVEDYKRHLRHERVYALPFAAAPYIHNPIRMGNAPVYDVCFAGTWYGQFRERCRMMRTMLEPLVPIGLHIFDRFYRAKGWKAILMRRYPATLAPAIQGSLKYAQMLQAYRSYKVFINVNTVNNSDTMFSRRVLEALACRTPVVSNFTAGLEAAMPDGVFMPHDLKKTCKLVQDLLQDDQRRLRAAHRGYRHVMQHHSCGKRLEFAVEMVLGVHIPKAAESVLIIGFADDQPSLDNLLQSYCQQTYEHKQMVVALSDLSIPRCVDQTRSDVAFIDRENLDEFAAVLTAAKTSNSPYIAVMSGRSAYLPNYLTDMMIPFSYSTANLVGKGTVFTLAEGSLDENNELGAEFEYVSSVHWETVICRRAAVETLQVTRQGNKKLATMQVDNHNPQTLSADKFNFILCRSHDWLHIAEPNRLNDIIEA